MKNSRAKGVRGELEVRNLIRSLGFEARRGQQFAGGADSPDVIHNIPGVYVEVKYVERLCVYGGLAQACRDAGVNDVPTLWHRRNRSPWVVSVQAVDLIRLAEKVMEGRDVSTDGR